MSEPTPLANPTAERACLGACLLEAEAARLVVEGLRLDDWTHRHHAVLYTAIRLLLSRGDPVDRLTVMREVQRISPEVPSTTLLDCEEATPTAAHVRHYIAQVQEAAKRRAVRALCQRTLQATERADSSLPESVAHLLEDLEIACGDADSAPGGRSLVPVALADALKVWLTEVDTHTTPPRIKTPLPRLNECLGGGFEPGDLCYLGARPGVGKTAFALETARAAAEKGVGVLVVSREMPVARLVRRILAQACRIPAGTIKAGLFTDAQYSVLSARYGELARLPLWLIDQAVSLEEITRIVERWSFTPPLGLVVVDYLQLVRAPSGIRERRLQVEAVSQGLKTLAMRCQLPVVCLSSLRRPENGNPDRKPTLSDLRESGELEHDADLVLFLHRAFNSDEATLIVAKNRDGRVGETELRFRSEFVSFEQAPEDA